jgi:hypothetical protein
MRPSSCQTRSKSEAISLRRSAAFGSTSQKAGEVAQDRIGALDLRIERRADPLQLLCDRLAAHLVFVFGQVAHDVELAQAFELAAQRLSACAVAALALGGLPQRGEYHGPQVFVGLEAA